MPRPSRRNRTFRKVKKVTPGNRNVIHYTKRKPQKAHCAGCKKPLKGTASERPVKMQNMPKTKKRPERPFGGMLCSACARQKIKQSARQ